MHVCVCVCVRICPCVRVAGKDALITSNLQGEKDSSKDAEEL